MISNEITMTYSAILRNKEGKKLVRVLFERKGPSGKEVAEGLIPDGVIQRRNGYSDKEVRELEKYLKENADDIMGKAKLISNPLKWL